MRNRGAVLLIIFAVGIASVFFLIKGNDTQTKTAAVGLEAPPFELKDINGMTWRLSDLRGKVVLLHFWASW